MSIQIILLILTSKIKRIKNRNSKRKFNSTTKKPVAIADFFPYLFVNVFDSQEKILQNISDKNNQVQILLYLFHQTSVFIKQFNNQDIDLQSIMFFWYYFKEFFADQFQNNNQFIQEAFDLKLSKQDFKFLNMFI
ncbi:hypothetical protein M0811_00604 [Anaeramoeba ignava]|uniref:Uncharacterized protein n=1 Tax=Anaeramoeba ignava TaxID=1746090 RepID=A0A9Q0LRP3_ANAIG|nr:hypothetical protein M0811_00604 [Anaeramoeba ignava]